MESDRLSAVSVLSSSPACGRLRHGGEGGSAGLQSPAVIRAFADQATEGIFDGAATRVARQRCPRRLWRVARRKLAQLNQVAELQPLGISQAAFARRVGVSYPRLRGLIHARSAVTAEMALRLARVTGMTAEFWLGLQQDWDLWHAARSGKAEAIESLEPLSASPAS